MSFAKSLATDYPPTIRDRGRTYFEQGRVRIVRATPEAVEAEVRGSRPYTVTGAIHDDAFLSECDCEYAQGGERCKHQWATILALDERGLRPSLPVAVPNGLPAQAGWQRTLDAIANAHQRERLEFKWPPGREVVYLVDLDASVRSAELVIDLRRRDPRKAGGFSKAEPLDIAKKYIDLLPADDRYILRMLSGGSEYSWFRVGGEHSNIAQTYSVRYPLSMNLLEAASRTHRCFFRSRGGDVGSPLEWDGGEPWRLVPDIRHAGNAQLRLWGSLRRGDDSLDIREPLLVTRGGIFIHRTGAYRLADDTPFDLLQNLRTSPAIYAPTSEADAFVRSVLRLPGVAGVELPEELRYREMAGVPKPVLRISIPTGEVQARLWFSYEGREIPQHATERGIFLNDPRRLVTRDQAAEQDLMEQLRNAGARLVNPGYAQLEPRWAIASSKLQSVIRTLLETGWHVELKGARIRRAFTTSLSVSSGIDWFELNGRADYGDVQASLPELLEAVRSGQDVIRLSDGTYGVIPEEWLRKISLLTGMGTEEDGAVRFRRAQAGLLDALLAAQPEATWDAGFDSVHRELQSFRGIEAAVQPEGFVGQLRDYQREGLGWMEFLRRMSFGGCLADDMGVGKTAQVLALLETRRAAREAGEQIAPSLVVVPKSLIFNWKDEAARFTPRLRLADYTGTARSEMDLNASDVILTTYGTLRRDVPKLREIAFDYVVLDEAQAVKNASSESAKAVRLLQGDHRLAMSGTPVENRLEELWSLFEFLNPGMLGSASVFKGPGPDGRELLAQALRPFILRRTKEQVARELPPRTEQTIYCELEAPQRKLYDELRRHYRVGLLGQVAVQGLAKSKIQVLEALLRLRQAACHPGLLDAQRKDDASAKMEVLIDKLGEVVEEGHKALVFSQFTTMLGLVKPRLNKAGIKFEYLDGKTKDRQGAVERFQSDDGPPVFLISLKAGGLGLNLTAAGYVFLLDPWWNPAVEAQAVDRAHRIGQTRQVFAYRLIAKDTVEEKVLELQKSKRALADAIIGEDNSLIRDLKREDLELLLS